MSPCWFLHFYRFTDVLEDEHTKTQNYLCNFFVNLEVFQKKKKCVSDLKKKEAKGESNKCGAGRAQVQGGGRRVEVRGTGGTGAGDGARSPS